MHITKCSAFRTLMALTMLCESLCSNQACHFLLLHRVYKAEQKITPEIAAVYEYLASILGADCAGDKELTFLALRVCINAHNLPFTTYCYTKSCTCSCFTFLMSNLPLFLSHLFMKSV